MKKIKAAIVGATGFAGEKLVEVLLGHSGVDLVSVTCIEEPKPLGEHYPRFAGLSKLNLEPIVPERIARLSDVVFLALPHTISFKFVPFFLKKKRIVIDLSADYRLTDSSVYSKYYGVKHPDVKNIAKAVYGLPELYRAKIKKALLVANPGCYPTVSILSLAPLVKAGLVSNIIIDAKSGVTGAGRKANLGSHYATLNANSYAYKLFEHQHLPEINQILSNLSKKSTEVLFTPHVIPVEQGILVTVYADLKQAVSKDKLFKIYKDFYKNEFFIRLLKNRLPKLRDVYNTNFCDISLEVKGKKIIIVAAIDNLMRGASSQAVQNLNIVCGFNEKEGLL